ncbi:hypothetical protein J6I75_08665 [Pseudidiomarina sp. 1APP75-27a]|uniref:hypothetical protein n=1 Tax=Pseudidiomarina terrestris TaxID=2820060 RepID=UPI002B052775|nr:hypothetical protein [Pseudidiomarina sp. 1APP75-27a]MEA3588423.1 hypothetical protein [Pseudidiomarina sp. 1APP75-27a]
MSNRFIPPANIPKSLWSQEFKKLMLPELVVQSWYQIIKRESLEVLAKQTAPRGFEGGASKEDTDKHLAWRYTGSSARVILSMLDPHEELSGIADTYASTFAGNKVFLVDIPSGSGAAAISILCILYELRKHNALPRHPLKIFVLSGEISDSAKNYNDDQLAQLAPLLEEQAIWIECESISWDATCRISTSDLIKKATLKSQGYTNKLLVLSNFSGFLEHHGKWKEARQQIENIFLHSRDVNSHAIWLEPQRKTIPRFVSRLLGLFANLFGGLFRNDNTSSSPHGHSYASTESKCQHPLKEHTFNVRLTVLRFELPERKKI